MRVLYIAHSFSRGGAQKCLFDLVSKSKCKEIECYVIGPETGPGLNDYINLSIHAASLNLSSIFITKARLSKVRRCAKLLYDTYKIKRVIDKYKPDVVYTNTSTIMSGALAARINKIPHIWHIHENFNTFELNYILPKKLLSYLVEKLSTSIIFVSSLARHSLFPEGSPKAIVIHNGVVISTFKKNIQDFGKRERTYNIGFFGTLAHRKGIDILLTSVSLIYKKYPQMHVFLWGTGEQEYCEYLKSLAESLELSDCVMFRGYTSNMDDALLECDVVVVPSRAESFSLVTVEAMMAGIPVVVSRCGGPEEIVDDRIDGRIVSVGDHENLAEVLDELFANPDVAYEIAQKAVEKVKNHFSLDKKLEEIINVIFNASEMKSRKIY